MSKYNSPQVMLFGSLSSQILQIPTQLSRRSPVQFSMYGLINIFVGEHKLFLLLQLSPLCVRFFNLKSNQMLCYIHVHKIIANYVQKLQWGNLKTKKTEFVLF